MTDPTSISSFIQPGDNRINGRAAVLIDVESILACGGEQGAPEASASHDWVAKPSQVAFARRSLAFAIVIAEERR